VPKKRKRRRRRKTDVEKLTGLVVDLTKVSAVASIGVAVSTKVSDIVKK
jgi:hypothetical protein